MARNIFSVNPGRVIAIKDPFSVPFTLSFDDWGGFDARNAILQGVSVSTQGNYQFLHSLRNFIYVYIFGERIGEITLSGLAFVGKCPNNDTDGLSKVMEYYNKKGISFSGEPVNITVGRAPFSAFLVGAKFEIVNPKARIGQFALAFKLIPPDDLGAGEGEGGGGEGGGADGGGVDWGGDGGGGLGITPDDILFHRSASGP
jgi:hypothetical protein